MFWKKNKNDQEFFTYESVDRRAYYRIAPSENDPVVFKFSGQNVQALDIGAGGLSFQNQDFKTGDSQYTDILLPYQNVTISLILEIVEIDDENICHCRFAELDNDGVEAIHQYVLDRQKELLHSQKNGVKKEPA